MFLAVFPRERHSSVPRSIHWRRSRTHVQHACSPGCNYDLNEKPDVLPLQWAYQQRGGCSVPLSSATVLQLILAAAIRLISKQAGNWLQWNIQMIRLFTKRILILEFQALTTHDNMTCHDKHPPSLPPSLRSSFPACRLCDIHVLFLHFWFIYVSHTAEYQLICDFITTDAH